MFKDGLFRGKRILVTGGGTGLGKGMAEKFLALGAEVFICGRRKSVCEATAAELTAKHGGKVTSYGIDIHDAAADHSGVVPQLDQPDRSVPARRPRLLCRAS